MSYIVVVQTVKDLENITHIHYGLPDDYPILCKEYGSLEDIKADPKLSGSERVFSIEQYNQMRVKYNEVHKLMHAKKPWWKPFWWINWKRAK